MKSGENMYIQYEVVRCVTGNSSGIRRQTDRKHTCLRGWVPELDALLVLFHLLLTAACGRQNDASPARDVHVLIRGTCGYVTVHDKRDFTCVIELRVLSWRLSWIIQVTGPL